MLAMVDADIDIQAADIAICQTERRLKRAGLTRTYYMQKLKDLCEATKPISCIRGKEADGGTVDFVDVPDNTVQLNAVRTIIDLYGDSKPKKLDVNMGGNIMATVAKVLTEGK